jgi:hypothetical protein
MFQASPQPTTSEQAELARAGGSGQDPKKREKRGAEHGIQKQAEAASEPPDFKRFYSKRASHLSRRPRWNPDAEKMAGAGAAASPPPRRPPVACHLAPPRLAAPARHFRARPPPGAAPPSPILRHPAYKCAPRGTNNPSRRRRILRPDHLLRHGRHRHRRQAPRLPLRRRNRRAAAAAGHQEAQVRRPRQEDPGDPTCECLGIHGLHYLLVPWLAPPYILVISVEVEEAVVGRGGGEARWAGGPGKGGVPSSSCSPCCRILKFRWIAIGVPVVVDVCGRFGTPIRPIAATLAHFASIADLNSGCFFDICDQISPS